jgi:hypothetical protein
MHLATPTKLYPDLQVANTKKKQLEVQSLMKQMQLAGMQQSFNPTPCPASPKFAKSRIKEHKPNSSGGVVHTQEASLSGGESHVNRKISDSLAKTLVTSMSPREVENLPPRASYK